MEESTGGMGGGGMAPVWKQLCAETALCRGEPHTQRGHSGCRGEMNYGRVRAIHKDEPKYNEIVQIDLDSLLCSHSDQHMKKQKLSASCRITHT